MSNRGFFHFSALPMSTRMVYTMTLLVLGTGYLFAMLQVFYSHAGLDGNAKNISAQDIRIAYHGSETDTRLVTALKGPMAGMLPEAERAVIFKWVDSGAQQDAFESNVKPIIESRCLACHDGSNPHIPLLTSFDEVTKIVAKDTGATIPALVRVSHIHLFGITFIFFIVSSIFTHAYMRPLWLKCVIIVLPFLTILTDIFSWYLTKWIPGFAWFIIGSGALMGISFTVQWVVSMWQMWFYTLPDEIEECGGTLPVMGQKSRTQDM
ncbi:MAG: elongation factor-1 alpha [Thiobacillus sp.]|nr:elongation factor-1 alpha [Thiobacillus sp.]